MTVGESKVQRNSSIRFPERRFLFFQNIPAFLEVMPPYTHLFFFRTQTNRYRVGFLFALCKSHSIHSCRSRKNTPCSSLQAPQRSLLKPNLDLTENATSASYILSRTSGPRVIQVKKWLCMYTHQQVTILISSKI